MWIASSLRYAPFLAMTLDSNVWIEIFLFANGGGFAVTAKDLRFVRQGEQSGADGLAKLIEVTAWEVSAAYTAAEKGIAGEDPALNGSVKTHTPFGMTRRADHLQNTLSHFDLLVILQIHIRLIDVADRLESQPHRLALGLDEVVMGVGMGRNGNVIATFHGVVADHMIHMAVGVDHHQRLHPMTVDKAEQTVFLRRRRASRIDDDTLLGLIVNEIGVLTERVENKRFKYEHTVKF